MHPVRRNQKLISRTVVIRKHLGLEASLYQILQILSVTLFEKTPILQAFQTFNSQDDLDDSSNQLSLFDF